MLTFATHVEATTSDACNAISEVKNINMNSNTNFTYLVVPFLCFYI